MVYMDIGQCMDFLGTLKLFNPTDYVKIRNMNMTTVKHSDDVITRTIKIAIENSGITSDGDTEYLLRLLIGHVMEELGMMFISNDFTLLDTGGK